MLMEGLCTWFNSTHADKAGALRSHAKEALSIDNEDVESDHEFVWESRHVPVRQSWGRITPCIVSRDENGTDIFRPYSKPNPFRGVEICPYPSSDIQHPISYPYPNTQIAYL